jgi:uncharacterized damage-inducible protein DinB
MNAMLGDAFAHHVWATEQLIDACIRLPHDQLATAVPGTYGSILSTLRHLVGSDAWYLAQFRPGRPPIDEDDATLEALRAAITANGAAWHEVIETEGDPDREIIEMDDGWRVHSPVGVRLAQVVHHGTDHRSQVCTALSSLGIAPPEIDVWAYARAAGREHAERL